MFHKVKAVNALPDFRLSVQFAEGVTKIYDVKPLFTKWAPFKALGSDPALFSGAEVDVGGYGIVWNDTLDLSCDELFANGETVQTPFDGLMAFTDATQLGGSTRVRCARQSPTVSSSTAWTLASSENSG